MADRTRYTANLVSDNNLYVDPTTDRVGIGTTNPTSKLYVVGDTYVTGILTANRIFSNVYGEFTGGSISGADIVGTALSISGISTFTNGPVFIGSGTSTGTASQRLQVTGGAYVSGNLGIGLTNPSQSLHVQGNARVTGAVYDSTNSAGTSGQVLQSTVTGTQWVSAAPAGAVTGLVIRDSNNNIVGSSGSITQLTFGSGFGVTGTTGPAGIATVTLSSNLVGTSLSISGISTLGVTSTTNLTAQQLNVSGVVTATSFYGSGANLTGLIANTVATSSTTTPQFIGFLTTNSGISTSILASSTLTYIPSSGNLGIGTTAPTSKLDVVGNVRVSGISTLGITSTTNLTAQQLNVSGISTFQSSNLKVRNPTNTFEYSIVGSAIAANRNLTIPLLTGDDTIATLGLDQTFTGNQTFGGTLSATATISLSGAGAGAHLFGSNQTTGSLTFGGTSGTGNITFGRATTSQTTNIQAGVTASGNQKTINLGTSGASGSFTQINIGPGPSAGVGTVLINTGTRLGIGSAIPRAALDVAGDVRVSGVVTATTFVGALTGTATTATKLETARTFQITGDVVASAISFDGTGNVSLAATIQPNSVGLGTDTTGDYVTNITGTSNQITVTSGTGEGSTPTLSIPSQFTAPQDVTVTRDLQVNRNLNVNGNITIGGTSAALFSQTLSIFDPDIVLGYRTDAFGNDVSNDSTANHGGVALASTEGTPLVDLFIAGIETNPSTYKKIMWFKSGTFSGLGTDAWLINYAVGIGSTQVPNEVRLAAGNVQFTQNDLAVVRNINASGVVTAISFSGNASSATYATTAGVSTSVIGGIGSITQLSVSGVSTVGFLTATGIWNAGITTSSRITLNGANNTADGGGQIYLNGATGNRIDFNTNGIATPTFTTRSAGTKIVLYPTSTPSTSVDYAFGIASNILWSSVNDSGASFRWYAGTTQLADLKGTGELVIGSTSLTGTASQRLQVTGGAYVSGSVGIATTNPVASLQVKDALAFETTNTTTTTTSQVAVDTFATATFRSAKYQAQITCPGQISVLGGITTGGRGYTAGTFNVTFTTSSGNGSAAQGTLVVSNGTVGQISVSSGGSGYTAGDVLTASGGSGLQVSVGTTSGTGAILTLGSITSAGIGYTAGVGVGTTSLTFLGGTGTGAVGLATIFDGVITSSTLLQQPTTGTGGTTYYSGSNYSTASVLSVTRSDLTNTITTITGSVGVSTFTSLTTHGLFVNDIIRSSSTSNGLTAGTDYYVVTTPTTTTFTLGTSLGVGITFTAGTSLSIGFFRNSANAGGQVAYTNAITGVSTNHQVSDLMVLQNGTNADFIEYATIANDDVLGTFAADISGANARLLFTPTYPNNTIKVARQAITV
jgi:hypothetical protein